MTIPIRILSLLLSALSLPLLAAPALAAAEEAPELAQALTPPPEAQRLPSGLVTLVLQEGTGEARPKPSDRVIAHYVGRYVSGAVFMDSYATGKPSMFTINTVFPGWREGLLLMVEGEKRRLWIPPELGPKNPEKGPTNDTVVFDVELVSIVSAPPPPEDLKSPPDDAVRSPAGSKYRVLQQGTGTEKPEANDGLVLRWVGWGPDGVIFDSTGLRGKPTLFPLDKMPRTLAGCARDMVEGESRRCWIPAGLADGIWAGAPKGDLVFDLQLMRIIDGDELFGSQPSPDHDSQR